jgi:hypothetical protein
MNEFVKTILATKIKAFWCRVTLTNTILIETRPIVNHLPAKNVSKLYNLKWSCYGSVIKEQ